MKNYRKRVLRWGIPPYRLPREIIDQEIQDILDTGVELKTNTKVGRDISFDELGQKFDHIFVAIGAGIPGEGAEGFIGAVEMLRAYNLGTKVNIGRKVAVIGGGNSAIDASRTTVRLGADSVTIYYRRERKDMPAQEEEIKAAEEEGVKIEYLTAPVKAVVKKGKVVGLELSRMKFGTFDKTGRKKTEAIPGSEFTVEVDTIIPAIGQGAELNFIPPSSGIETGRTYVKVNDKLQTKNAKVWVGGDVVTGPAMVIDAIKAGQDVAKAIDDGYKS